MIPKGSFEPTVMFFGLTNSLATFQTMMNELLRDLINTGKVAAFIDDVIIGMESEEEHDELVVEVIKRLEENNSYIKPEKCKWKVREVGFLGVIIGVDGIKIEEEKVKGVLDWPTHKYVKDVQKFLGLANYYCRFIEGFTSIARCYDLESLEWDSKTTLVLSNTKELDRELFYKLVYFI